MSTPRRPLSAAIAALAVVTAASAVVLAAGAGASPSTSSAAQASTVALDPSGSLSFQPVLGLPASDVELIGASPGEAAGEVWAQGRVGAIPAATGGQPISDTETLLRYTSSSGAWQVVPVQANGDEALDFDWWGSEVTANGGVVLAGEEESGEKEPGVEHAQSVVTRNPDGAFVEAPPPSASGPQAVIAAKEQLYPTSSSAGRPSVDPLMAALDESGGKTGALVVPVWAGEPAPEGEPPSGEPSEEPATVGEPGVLHYDGGAWTREPICSQYSSGTCKPASATIKPLAMAASSPQDAWLLARSSTGELELFQRVTLTGSEPPATPIWIQVAFSSGLFSSGGAPTGESLSPPSSGPILTATNNGVWVDLQLNSGGQAGSATLLASAATQGSAPEGSNAGTVLGTWCYPTSLCPAGTPSLGAALPSDYASFAWPGSGSGAGTRIITGLADGALLRMEEGQGGFSYVVGGGAGGGGGAVGPGGVTIGQLPGTVTTPGGGAAFASSEEGWLGDDTSSGTSTTPQAIHVTSTPSGSSLTSWPVPFRRPLLAIATQPRTTPGAPGAQALAVGVDGEIARYTPGQGWSSESLYNSNGERQTPNLRGVAWPEPERAYAVGDNGAMWLWQADSGLWEPDPAAPVGFRGQLTAIAFSPGNPELGYAVGKQGVLLGYDKTWSQEPLPAGLAEANFTSVAFAGEEAIATYRLLTHSASDPGQETGGLIVNDGSGWQLDPSAQALLTTLPAQDTVLSKVAGLPNGGAVAAGPGLVIERDSATSSWRFSSAPLPEAGNVAALAAVQEGSSVRALVSLDPDDEVNGDPLYEEIDDPPGPPLGQYGQLLGPDPLPGRGFLLRETTSGWDDEENEDYAHTTSTSAEDLPGWPDAVLALLVEPSGEAGWAVGGQTGEELASYGQPGAQEAAQTAGVMRYGTGPTPPQSTSAPVLIPAGEASFAVGGDAQCAAACADFANEQLGPDAWLSGAISHAGQIPGLRAFLYTGSRIGPSGTYATNPGSFERELARYASVLGGGSLPVYTTISPSDIQSGGSVTPFTEALGAFMPDSGSEKAYYAVSSPGTSGGTVRVIVLDYSASALGGTQEAWLRAELESAKSASEPAIVLGSANISEPGASNYAKDAAAVGQILLTGGASAYLFDSPEENVVQSIGSGTETIHTYGSGTLGYVHPNLNDPDDFLGASGFLVVSIDGAQRSAQTGRAPVTASLIPSIEQLGLEANDGTLLRRSQVALFSGLARRPLGGVATLKSNGNDITEEAPDPYTPIPESCLGTNCSQFIAPAYAFTSSNPEVGQFVEQNPTSTNPRAALQVNGKPVTDPASGLFCAFNAGTTTVTLSTGGLSYSEQVTVQPGSVEQPCGTVPLVNPPPVKGSQPILNPIVPAPPLEPAPATTSPSVALTPPPVPVPLPAAAPKVTHRKPFVPTPLFLIPSLTPTTPLRAALPPPAPQPARPTPPSGTSQVTEPVGVAEEERKEQGAVDVVHNAAAYEPGGNSLPPWSPAALIVIAAAAGAGVGRARRDRSRVPAWASVRSDPPDPRR
jgi:hypothetical protein